MEEVGQFVTEFSIMRKAAAAYANGEDMDTVKQIMMEEQQASRGFMDPPFICSSLFISP